MSSTPPQSVASAMASAADPSGQPLPSDRRRYRRLPVTVSARVLHAETSYRTEILDVSDGGMLLAPIEALTATEQQIIQIDSTPLGRIDARIVGISRMGIHVEVALSPRGYPAAVERLHGLTRAWTRP